MPTTPKGLRYPATTDSADVPRDIQNLATDVDGKLSQSPEVNLKTIRGNVNGDGTVAGGAGFSVTKGAAGVYTINFSTAFTANPSVTVNVLHTTPGAAFIVTPLGAGSVGVRTTNLDGVAVDYDFLFIAIGPA